MFLQSLLNLRNLAIWHGEIKGSYRAKLQKFSNLRLNNAHCVGLKGSTIQKFKFFFLSRLLEWALMAPWNTRSLSQKQLSTHERGSSSYLLYAIWFIFTRSWWFDRLLCSLILLSIFSDQHTGAIWVEKMQKKWIKRVEEIALKSVLKSLEQNAVQWLPIFNLAFFISCTFSNQFGAVCKSNSIAVVVIVVAQNHLFSRDEWRHIQLTGDW